MGWSKEKMISFQRLLQIQKKLKPKGVHFSGKTLQRRTFYVSKKFSYTTVAGRLQVIDLTWPVPDLYLQQLPGRYPRVTWQDVNPTKEEYFM